MEDVSAEVHLELRAMVLFASRRAFLEKGTTTPQHIPQCFATQINISCEQRGQVTGELL